MMRGSHMLGRRRLLLLIGGAAGCGGRVSGSSSGSSEASDASSLEDAAAAVDAGRAQDASGDASEEVSTSGDAAGPTDGPGPADSADAGDDGSDSGPPGLDAGCPPSNVVTVSFAAHPGLVTPGGSAMLTVQCYTDPICGENGIVVVHTMGDRYLAFSSGCTHACCNLGFTGTTLLCVCDGGTFDMTGRPIAGPPSQPLPVLPTTWDANAVYVTI